MGPGSSPLQWGGGVVAGEVGSGLSTGGGMRHPQAMFSNATEHSLGRSQAGQVLLWLAFGFPCRLTTSKNRCPAGTGFKLVEGCLCAQMVLAQVLGPRGRGTDPAGLLFDDTSTMANFSLTDGFYGA